MSTTGSNPFGTTFVAGRNRVPSPAAGITAVRTLTGGTVPRLRDGVGGGYRYTCAAMPTYEYRCRSCGHSFDIVQKMSDEPLTHCPECGGELRKVFAPPAISFKGSGFYATDHGKNARPSGEPKKEDSGAASDGSKDTKGDPKGDPKGDTKSDRKGGETSASTSSVTKKEGSS